MTETPLLPGPGDRGRLRELADNIDSPLVYLCPSRGRPGNVARLVDAWEATTIGAAALVVAIDHDDPTLPDYLDALGALDLDARGGLSNVHVAIGERLRLGGTLNALAPELAANGRRGVGFLGDDHVPRTFGWDADLADVLDDTPAAVVYGNDLLQGATLPTAVCLAGVIVRALGYFVPPGMTHLYLDNYWKELGRRLGTLTYLPDIIIEHMHPLAGKAPTDARYAEVNHPDVYAADEARYRRYVAEELADAVAAVRAAVDLEAAA